MRQQRGEMAAAGLALARRELLDDGAGVVGDVAHAQGQQAAGGQHGVDRGVEPRQIAQRGDRAAPQEARPGGRRPRNRQPMWHADPVADTINA
jgi:hypothetical protein